MLHRLNKNPPARFSTIHTAWTCGNGFGSKIASRVCWRCSTHLYQCRSQHRGKPKILLAVLKTASAVSDGSNVSDLYQQLSFENRQQNPAGGVRLICITAGHSVDGALKSCWRFSTPLAVFDSDVSTQVTAAAVAENPAGGFR